MTNFTGTSGNDNFNGTSGIDSFDLSQGGDDTASGSLGIDTFNLGAALTAADTLDGGADSDSLALAGAYNLVFGAATITSIESITLGTGFDYRLTTNDANVAAAVIMQIHAQALGVGDFLNFDGSAETNGRFNVTAGAGDDKITGGAGNDSLTLGSGSDRANGGGGNDGIILNASLDKTDRLDGGTSLGDNDGLFLAGDYLGGVTLGAKTITGIETINLGVGHSYKLTLNDGNVAAGTTLSVTSQQIHLSTFIKINGSAETDGAFIMTGATGEDILIGGEGADELTGKGNSDRLEGGAGADTYKYLATSDSTSTAYDVVVGFDTAEDVFELAFGGAGGIDPTVGSGRLSTGNFDTQLANAIGAGELAGLRAVIFKPDDGNLAGHIFLIVDRNGAAGYQTGADHVFELVDPVHLGALTTGNII